VFSAVRFLLDLESMNAFLAFWMYVSEVGLLVPKFNKNTLLIKHTKLDKCVRSRDGADPSAVLGTEFLGKVFQI